MPGFAYSSQIHVVRGAMQCAILLPVSGGRTPWPDLYSRELLLCGSTRKRAGHFVAPNTAVPSLAAAPQGSSETWRAWRASPFAAALGNWTPARLRSHLRPRPFPDNSQSCASTAMLLTPSWSFGGSTPRASWPLGKCSGSTSRSLGQASISRRVSLV